MYNLRSFNDLQENKSPSPHHKTGNTLLDNSNADRKVRPWDATPSTRTENITSVDRSPEGIPELLNLVLDRISKLRNSGLPDGHCL